MVTYRERESGFPFLTDLLQQEEPSPKVLWLVSWGFDVPLLLRRLRGHSVIYQAHSTGYGFDLPAGVPVLAVSRNTLGYWGDRAPRNPLFLLPNALEPQWLACLQRGEAMDERAIDVLVQKRKSSPYVLNHLVPALRAKGLRVEVQDGWVDDLLGLFQSASVYIYDSAVRTRSGRVSSATMWQGLKPPCSVLGIGDRTINSLCRCSRLFPRAHCISDGMKHSKVLTVGLTKSHRRVMSLFFVPLRFGGSACVAF